jgi:hypothetical protein
MPKIPIEELMRNSPFPEWKLSPSERLSDAASTLRSNAADLIDRVTEALPQPGSGPRRRNDRMTFGAWNLDESEPSPHGR